MEFRYEIPNTYRGQPKNWKKSKYCSITKAKETFQDLIKLTKSKYILISYNDGGIIPLDELEEILSEYGSVSKIPIEHKTYNKLKGIASYKRKKEYKEVKEYGCSKRINHSYSLLISKTMALLYYKLFLYFSI